jgi:hypothetical protein
MEVFVRVVVAGALREDRANGPRVIGRRSPVD